MGGFTATELETFHRFIGKQLEDGSELTPEECLCMWRTEQPTADEVQDSVAAVKRALEQAGRGAGKNVHEFDRDFRVKHGISDGL